MANNDKSSGMAVMLGAAQIKERFAKGSDEAKALLKDLFGEKLFTRPTLDDHTTIKTYEDACEALGIEPVDFVNLAVPDHIKALMKLETISRALWGKSWEPKPQAEWDGNTYFWFPWFCLYTKEEVAQIKSNPEDYDCAALFGGSAATGAYAGFGCLKTHSRPTDTHPTVGSACARNQKKRHGTLRTRLRSFGQNTWRLILPLEKESCNEHKEQISCYAF